MSYLVPVSGEVTDTLKNVGGGAWDIFTGIFKAKGAIEAQQQQAAMNQPVVASSTPSWLPFAAIGGGALLLVLLLKKKR